MLRTALRQRQQRRRRTSLDAVREVAKWLNAQQIRYCKTTVAGIPWKDARNRGAPPLLVMAAAPARPSVVGVAIYIWPGGYAQVTESQDRWINHFHKKGWCVLLTHSAEEALEMLRELGYEQESAGA